MQQLVLQHTPHFLLLVFPRLDVAPRFVFRRELNWVAIRAAAQALRAEFDGHLRANP